MSYLDKATIRGLIVICLYTWFAVSANSQLSITNRTLPKTSLTGLGLRGIVWDLSTRFDVPIGMETVRPLTPKTVYRKTVDFPPGTLASLLDRIVAIDRRYSWDEDRSFIHIYSKDHREALLDTRIHEFSARGLISEEGLKERIFNLPEVKSAMNNLGIQFLNVMPDVWTGEIRRSFSVSVHEVTLRDLLDQIARDSEYHCWVSGRWGAKNEFITVEF